MEKITKIPSYPDPLATFEEKKSDAFGVQIGKYISSQWFGGNGFITTGCAFLDRRDYVRKKRLLVRGEQSVKQLKDAYSPREGALELVNLDFTNINVVEKFARVVSGGLDDDNWKLDIRATDRFSTINKQNKHDYYTKYMAASPMLEKAKNQLGINLMPKGYIPEDEQELKIHMELNERPRIEIAEEILIDYILKTNDWDYLGKEYNKEIVDVGLVVARVYYDKNDGIKVAWVDSENYVHSKVRRRDFKDKFYEGVVDTITLSDLRRESDFDEATLRKIGKIHNASKSIDWDRCPFDDIIDYKVDVLRFAFKTSKTLVYKKKTYKGEIVNLSKRPENWDGIEKNKLTKTLDTWLEGNYIVGSEYIYGYGECENMYDDVMNKALSPFITFAHKIYENRLQSFTTNIEAPAKMLQRISNKIQLLVNELKPDGIEIDLDMLAELDDGSGGSKKLVWETALNIFEVKGVVFSKRANLGEDGIKDRPAVTPMAYQQGTALPPLLNTWAHYYNLIRELTGINPARDGSMSADALVGVNELAQLASNTVTRDIVDTMVMFKKRICEVISSRIKTVFKYDEAAHVREIYENVVGKELLNGVELLKNRHLHEFGFTYEMYPTVKELQEFREDLGLAIQEGYIDAYIRSEAVRLARINIKLATAYVRSQIKQAKKQRMQEQMALAQNKSQNDAAAAQAKAQSDTEAYATKKKIDLDYEAQKAKIEVAKTEALNLINQPKEERQFQQDVFIEKIKSASEWNTKKYLEDRKDDRTGIQATQQSEIKHQSQTDGQPIDFENSNSWFEPTL